MQDIVLNINYLQEEKIKVMLRAQYSSDSVLSEFWLLGYLKPNLGSYPNTTGEMD